MPSVFRSAASERQISSSIHADLTIESLRRELEHFSRKLVSDDLMPSMKQLIEETLTPKTGPLDDSDDDQRVRAASKETCAAVEHSGRKKYFASDKTMTKWFTRKGARGSETEDQSKQRRTIRKAKENPHSHNNLDLDECMEIPEEELSGLLVRELVRPMLPAGVDNRTLARSGASNTTLEHCPNGSEEMMSSQRTMMRKASTMANPEDDDDDNETAASEEHKNESAFSRFVRSKSFDYIFCFLLGLSALMLGLQTDYCARNWSHRPPVGFAIANRCFCCVFLIEIACRMHVYGPFMFFTGVGWQYNVFDSLVVFLQVLEELIAHIVNEESHRSTLAVSLVRLLRYFRLLRIMRLTRAMNFLVSFRMLVVSIIASLQSLGWVILLLVLQTFVASIPLTQLATDYKLTQEQHQIDEKLEQYYGNLSNTMLALYEILAEGLHWDELMRPLVEHTSPWLIFFFVAYSAFSIFAMMNVVTGIFVESALVTAEESRKTNLLRNLKSVFMHEGSINLEMFELEMTTNPNLVYFLKAIDIVPSDSTELFVLLDIDESGEIDAEELSSGLTRLQGNAKAMELAVLMYQFSKFTQHWESHARQIEGDLSTIIHATMKLSDEKGPNSSQPKSVPFVTNQHSIVQREWKSEPPTTSVQLKK